MRKIIFLLLLFLFQNVFAIEELKDVGIAKYAVLEVIKDDAPLREKNSENAQRITHLFKNAILFADKQTDKYYRVELKDNTYAFINKKYVEVQAVIPEKRFDTIKKVAYKNDKNKYQLKIETETQNAFIVKEDNTNLDFTLYDSHFDPIETKIKNEDSKFILPSIIQNELNVKYNSINPLFGYDVTKYDEGYILSVKKQPKINRNKPLKHIKIVVDAGHGGNELGACAFNENEKTINLEIAKKLRKELKKRGAKVYLTRKKDVKVGLYDRVNFAKEKDADIMLSIHQNSLANKKDVYKKHGVGTYYYHNQAKPLAEHVQASLLKETKFRDDKVNHASFVVTRPSMPVSILIECGYIIHKEEFEKITDTKFQKRIAKAITKGVENYLNDLF